MGLGGLVQSGFPGAIAIALAGSAPATLRYLFASVRLPWLLLAFLLVIVGLCGAWWSWLRGSVPVRRPDEESDLIELAMLRAVVASLPDLIYVKDAKSRFLLANKATAAAMGALLGSELLGKTDFDFYPREVAEGFFHDEQKVIRSGQPLVSQDEHIREPDGRTRWIMTTKVPLTDGVGRAVGIIGIGRNITSLKELEAKLRKAQQELEFKAAHDSLTGLLNRGAAMEFLEREFARAQRTHCRTAVVLGDLDYFKNVNDAYGHPTGDEVLCEVARRLQAAVRSYDMVGRFGGEEFLIALPECEGVDAMKRANHLRLAIAATPIATARGPMQMTISFGVLAAEGRDGLSVDQALREVDSALYAAKAAGRNQCKMAEISSQ